MDRQWRRIGLLAAAASIATGGSGATQAPSTATPPPTVEEARAQCRTLAGDGTGVKRAGAYAGTRLVALYWRFRDGYRVQGERDGTTLLRLSKATWGGLAGGDTATIAFRDGQGRWRAAQMVAGARTATQYSLWRTGALTPETGAALDALLADPCLDREPESIIGKITAPGGAVIGPCGDAVGSVTYALEVTVGGRSRMFTRQCRFGLAGALAGRLDRPELAGPETEERF